MGKKSFRSIQAIKSPKSVNVDDAINQIEQSYDDENKSLCSQNTAKNFLNLPINEDSNLSNNSIATTASSSSSASSQSTSSSSSCFTSSSSSSCTSVSTSSSSSGSTETANSNLVHNQYTPQMQTKSHRNYLNIHKKYMNKRRRQKLHHSAENTIIEHNEHGLGTPRSESSAYYTNSPCSEFGSKPSDEYLD